MRRYKYQVARRMQNGFYSSSGIHMHWLVVSLTPVVTLHFTVQNPNKECPDPKP